MLNQAWPATVQTATLWAWLKLLALDGNLTKAKPEPGSTDPAHRRPSGAKRTSASGSKSAAGSGCLRCSGTG